MHKRKFRATNLCKCGYYNTDSLDTDDRPVCLDCKIMSCYAADLGVGNPEFRNVPADKKPAFLSKTLSDAILSKRFEINPEWAREVWAMLDDIKARRSRLHFNGC